MVAEFSFRLIQYFLGFAKRVKWLNRLQEPILGPICPMATKLQTDKSPFVRYFMTSDLIHDTVKVK